MILPVPSKSLAYWRAEAFPVMVFTTLVSIALNFPTDGEAAPLSGK